MATPATHYARGLRSEERLTGTSRHYDRSSATRGQRHERAFGSALGSLALLVGSAAKLSEP